MKRNIAQTILNYFAPLAVVCSLFLAPLLTQIVAADSIADGVCKGILSAEEGPAGINEQTTRSSCFESGDQSFGSLVRRVINVFSIVVGAVSVIMIIIGGFRYIISGGDSAGVSAAKNTILYAIVGLVIVLFAQVIIRFVYSNVNPSSPTPNTNSSSSLQLNLVG